MFLHQADVFTDFVALFASNVPLYFRLIMIWFTIYTTCIVYYQVYDKKQKVEVWYKKEENGEWIQMTEEE